MMARGRPHLVESRNRVPNPPHAVLRVRFCAAGLMPSPRKRFSALVCSPPAPPSPRRCGRVTSDLRSSTTTTDWR